VADEVRNLAEMSEKSARGIQEVVNEIQNQVKVVAADTETTGKRGREEVEKARVVTADLAKVAQNLRTTFHLFGSRISLHATESHRELGHIARRD